MTPEYQVTLHITNTLTGTHWEENTEPIMAVTEAAAIVKAAVKYNFNKTGTPFDIWTHDQHPHHYYRFTASRIWPK